MSVNEQPWPNRTVSHVKEAWIHVGENLTVGMQRGGIITVSISQARIPRGNLLIRDFASVIPFSSIFLCLCNIKMRQGYTSYKLALYCALYSLQVDEYSAGTDYSDIVSVRAPLTDEG